MQDGDFVLCPLSDAVSMVGSIVEAAVGRERTSRTRRTRSLVSTPSPAVQEGTVRERQPQRGQRTPASPSGRSVAWSDLEDEDLNEPPPVAKGAEGTAVGLLSLLEHVSPAELLSGMAHFPPADARHRRRGVHSDSDSDFDSDSDSDGSNTESFDSEGEEGPQGWNASGTGGDALLGAVRSALQHLRSQQTAIEIVERRNTRAEARAVMRRDASGDNRRIAASRRMSLQGILASAAEDNSIITSSSAATPWTTPTPSRKGKTRYSKSNTPSTQRSSGTRGAGSTSGRSSSLGLHFHSVEATGARAVLGEARASVGLDMNIGSLGEQRSFVSLAAEDPYQATALARVYKRATLASRGSFPAFAAGNE
jgi:hypothetical protein